MAGDLLYVNAFNTQVPYLFINRGASQPGFFDMESAARGLTEALSSGGAAFGDRDDDGDLDLIISDSATPISAGRRQASPLPQRRHRSLHRGRSEPRSGGEAGAHGRANSWTWTGTSTSTSSAPTAPAMAAATTT